MNIFSPITTSNQVCFFKNFEKLGSIELEERVQCNAHLIILLLGNQALNISSDAHTVNKHVNKI